MAGPRPVASFGHDARAGTAPTAIGSLGGLLLTPCPECLMERPECSMMLRACWEEVELNDTTCP